MNGYLLLLTAILIFLVILLPSTYYAIRDCKDWNGYLLALGKAVDMFGNVFAKYFFNAVMITQDAPMKFGQDGVLCSDVFAADYKAGKCRRLGRFVCRYLIRWKDPSFKN